MAMDHAVLQSLDPMSRMIYHQPCMHQSPGTLRQYQSTLKTILLCWAWTWYGAFVTVQNVRTARYKFTYLLIYLFILNTVAYTIHILPRNACLQHVFVVFYYCITHCILIVLFYCIITHYSYIQQSSCSAVQLQACINKVELSWVVEENSPCWVSASCKSKSPCPSWWRRSWRSTLISSARRRSFCCSCWA